MMNKMQEEVLRIAAEIVGTNYRVQIITSRRSGKGVVAKELAARYICSLVDCLHDGNTLYYDNAELTVIDEPSHGGSRYNINRTFKNGVAPLLLIGTHNPSYFSDLVDKTYIIPFLGGVDIKQVEKDINPEYFDSEFSLESYLKVANANDK